MNAKLATLLVATTLGLALLAACAGHPAGMPVTPRVSLLPPVVSTSANPTTAEKVALGGQLWIDTRLSGSGKLACTSCHVREKGWTDGLVLSRRDNGEMNTRHTPTVYDVGYLTSWYWDGRAITLEAQVFAAWRSQLGADPVKATAGIAAVPGYVTQFQKIFGAPPSQESISMALAAWLRANVSGTSPWDRFEMGKGRAVSADAKAGYAIFMGKARCAACHVPPLYSDGKFHNIGLEAGKAKPDLGRVVQSKHPEETSAFKTPTLRSVAISGPYFHDGSRASLEEAVRYMAMGGGDDSGKSSLLSGAGLSDAEIMQVVAFLTSLTSDETYVAPSLP
ncbi:MAG: cytochrome c peroxidase [Pseudomonadota bacterium]